MVQLKYRMNIKKKLLSHIYITLSKTRKKGL